MIAVLKRGVRTRQQTAEPFLSFAKRRRTDHLTLEVEKVEQKEDQGISVTCIRSRLDQAEGSLPVRANAAEFPVKIRLPGRQSGHGLGYRWVFVRPIEARPRQQLGPAAVEASVHAIAVVLDLVQPIRAAGRRIDQLAQLRLDPLRKPARIAARRGTSRSRNHGSDRSVRILSVRSSREDRHTTGEAFHGSRGVLVRRIVVDTNVFVAAGFNPRSAAARILTAVREGHFHLIWNEPTRRETELIMRQIPPLEWERVADLFRPEMEFLDPVDPERFVFVPDPEDRKFAALSVAAQTPLVTNDTHLLSHKNSIGIDVLTPRSFLAREGEDT